MLMVLAVLFAASIVAPALFSVVGRKAFHVLAGILGAGFALTVAYGGAVLQEPRTESYEWIPQLGIEIALRLDALSYALTLLITGVGALVMLYCARYFPAREAAQGPFAAQLFAFAAAMLGLVLSDDIVMLFIFWELTTILSFTLIGYSGHRVFARRSAVQALVVTTFGGLAMLIGLLWIGQLAGTYRISEIIAAGGELSGDWAVDGAMALILLGALSKSALVPFHFWLPAAMAAPTPVSAYLHAAAMVKAGVYLVARFAEGFHDGAFWLPMVLILGLVTMLIGAYRALRQTDIKLVLAYGTVSQLGFLVMVNGLGTRDAALAGIAMLLAHGLFKAALFMIVGIIDHKTGTRDLRVLSGIGRSQRTLLAAAIIAAASMAGLPPLFGFVAKEVVFESFYGYAEVSGAAGWALMAGIVVASALTVAYSLRFLWGAFGVKRDDDGAEAAPTEFHGRPDPVFLASPVILAGATLLFAVWPAPLQAIVEPFAEGFAPADPDLPDTYLALWHGFTPVLGLSVLTWALGLGIFWLIGRSALQQKPIPAPLDAERVYRYSLRALDDFAAWLTSKTQRGSLGWYLFIIFGVATVVPGVIMLMTEHQMPEDWIIAEQPLQAVLGAVIIAGGLGAVWAPKRFMAVLMMGLCGWGIAGMFAIQGAPDLALTLLLVESIILVSFVLALRSLPARVWTQNPTRFKLGRAVLGGAFGLLVMAAAALAMGGRVAEPVSVEYPWMSYEIGHGSNIVNVTLVDIRVWDTFGEITVIAAAATGVASLIFVKRRDVQRRSLHEVPTGSVGRILSDQELSTRQVKEIQVARSFATVAREAWLVAGRTLAPEHRSIIFEVITRLMFHTIILISLYLLLAGHNTPGGGFAGGLLAGLAFVLRYLAGGRYELEAAIPFSAGALMGWGLAIACFTGILPLFAGGQAFQSFVLDFDLPILGEHHFVSALLFDVGVYLVVIGLIVDVLRSLGSEIDVRSEQENQRSAIGHSIHSRTSMGVAR
ncbi:Na+/H+ antiporter subunit A [Nesterenkonia populi]|uniref:Na+/H+ antiporter subunit A n=1 Tax=Nesterenkonia populi TaxID=1591087 RepID=UPI0011BDDE37|nr:Na+/H+ antiporter subunit A [Nesterenkonia populi]